MPADATSTLPVLTAVAFDSSEVELAREIRQLAWEIVRLERWTREAASRSQLDRQSELQSQRELCVARRSRLMRELWESRRR